MVERLLAMQKVVGSSPIARSSETRDNACSERRGTQEAKGEVCKTSIRRFESAPRLQSDKLPGPCRVFSFLRHHPVAIGDRPENLTWKGNSFQVNP